MTRAALAAAGLGAASLLAAAPAALAGPLDEPVSITASAPSAVAPGAPFRLSVAVAADPGALDIAAPPLRLRVRFAPECGGSFAGTEGPIAIDRVLPPASAGTAYATAVSTEATLSAPGAETICAFLEDAQERQFATDTEATLVVGGGGPGAPAGGAACKAAKSERKLLGKRSRKLDRRIHRLRRKAKRERGAAKRRDARKLAKLRKKRHRLVLRSRKAKRAVAASCGSGGRG